MRPADPWGVAAVAGAPRVGAASVANLLMGVLRRVLRVVEMVVGGRRRAARVHTVVNGSEPRTQREMSKVGGQGAAWRLMCEWSLAIDGNVIWEGGSSGLCRIWALQGWSTDD